MATAVLRDCPWQAFALAGLSMGGYVALEIMRQRPARVTRLALLDTRARADVPEETARRRELMQLAQRGRNFAPVTKRMLPLMLHESRLNDEPLIQVIRDMAQRTGIEAYVRQQNAIIARADYRAMLPSIACPTLVLCGRQDRLTPLEDSREMAGAVPGARLVVVEDCGHVSSLERPADINRALQAWLAD